MGRIREVWLSMYDTYLPTQYTKLAYVFCSIDIFRTQKKGFQVIITSSYLKTSVPPGTSLMDVSQTATFSSGKTRLVGQVILNAQYVDTLHTLALLPKLASDNLRIQWYHAFSTVWKPRASQTHSAGK